MLGDEHFAAPLVDAKVDGIVILNVIHEVIDVFHNVGFFILISVGVTTEPHLGEYGSHAVEIVKVAGDDGDSEFSALGEDSVIVLFHKAKFSMVLLLTRKRPCLKLQCR